MMSGNNKGRAECPPGRLLCLRWDSYCFQALIIVIIVIIIYCDHCDHCHYCFQSVIIVIIVIVVTIVIIVIIVFVGIIVIIAIVSIVIAIINVIFVATEKMFILTKVESSSKFISGNKSSLVRSAPGGQQHSSSGKRILRNQRSSRRLKWTFSQWLLWALL